MRIRIGLFNYAVMCASRALVSAEKSEKMSVTDPRLTMFDTHRGTGAEWWVSVLFLSLPYSHGGWTKLATSQFVRSQNLYFRIGDVYASNSPTEFQLYGFQINLDCLRRWSGVSLSKVPYKRLESWFVYWKTALQMSWTGWMYECGICSSCSEVFSFVFRLCWLALSRAVRNPSERSGS